MNSWIKSTATQPCKNTTEVKIENIKPEQFKALKQIQKMIQWVIKGHRHKHKVIKANRINHTKKVQLQLRDTFMFNNH